MDIVPDEKLELGSNPGEYDFQADATGEKISTVLHGVVQPGGAIAPHAGAEQLDKMLRSLYFRVQGTKRDAEVVQSFLMDLWARVTSLIERVPHNHPGQGRLALMMDSLVEISEGEYDMWSKGVAVWEDLPMLGPEMRERWNWSATTRAGDTYLEIDGAREWINLNSFAARLHGLEIVDWENFAIWELRDSLEESHRRLPEIDISIMVAAQWIIHAGEVLFEYKTEEYSPRDLRSLRSGSLFGGSGGMSQGRWDFWKKRIGELSMEVSEDVKEVAFAALKKMGQVEDETSKRYQQST